MLENIDANKLAFFLQVHFADHLHRKVPAAVFAVPSAYIGIHPIHKQHLCSNVVLTIAPTSPQKHLCLCMGCFL